MKTAQAAFLIGGVAVWLSVAQAVSARGLNANAVRGAYARALRYERARQYKDAVRALAAVEDARPDDYSVNLRLGWLYYLSKNYDDSRRRYERAIKALPNSIEAKLGYLLPLLATGRYDQAEAVARQVTRVDRHNYYANVRLAFALRMQRKYEQDERVIRRMVPLYPSDALVLTEFGLVRMAKGETTQARRVFSYVLTLHPQNPTAIHILSRSARRRR